jgi:hypothetical protein
MALEDTAILDLIKSTTRIETKLDMLLADEMEDELGEDEMEDEDPMNWRNLLGVGEEFFVGGGSVNTAMADSSYDSSTGTYDGLPKTGVYNGGYGL